MMRIKSNGFYSNSGIHRNEKCIKSTNAYDLPNGDKVRRYRCGSRSTRSTMNDGRIVQSNGGKNYNHKC